LLAGDNGISIQKYATPEDHAELRGIAYHVPVNPSPTDTPAHTPRRKGKPIKVPKTKENTVFVVHGRDRALRDAIYEFLRALGLRVLEWGHAIRAARGSGGNPFVNDIVTKIMMEAQAIVVMLSPDDEAKLKDQFISTHERSTEGKLRGQARPNVLFETGIAVGTHHKKTVMVQVGHVKPFTDIGGMHILLLSNDERQGTSSPIDSRTSGARLIEPAIIGCALATLCQRPRRLGAGRNAPTSGHPKNRDADPVRKCCPCVEGGRVWGTKPRLLAPQGRSLVASLSSPAWLPSPLFSRSGCLIMAPGAGGLSSCVPGGFWCWP
jgi:predicted nucleotide-binding protein